MQRLWHDLRFGLRALWRKPAFLFAAVLSLMLGIGANTAIFTLLDAIFLRPLPHVDGDDLTIIYGVVLDEEGRPQPGPANLTPNSYQNFRDLRARSKTLDDLAIFQWQPVNLIGTGDPTRAIAMFVSANYFDVLGVTAARGRTFTSDEEASRGGRPVMVLTHETWQRLFGADPDVVGREINVNDRDFEIVGVGPPGFKGTSLNVDVDFWIPLGMYPEIGRFVDYFAMRGVGLWNAFGRLAEGVTPEQARAEVELLGEQLLAEFPQDNQGAGLTTRSFLEGVINPPVERESLLRYRRILVAAVSLVLLAACFNVAVLLLARGRERARELALRQALGAGRGRLVRQLLTENLLLFLIGAALSLPVARWSLDLLWRFRPLGFAEDAIDLRLDATVLAFAFALALATGLLFGLLPAWRASRFEVVSHLKAGTPLGFFDGGRRPRMRQTLVVLQVAVALVALLGAGFAQRNLQAAAAIDLGFAYDEIAVLTLAPGEQGYDEEQARAFYRRLLERIEALGGVRSATLSENRLLRGAVVRVAAVPEGEKNPTSFGGRSIHRINTVMPGYFETAGIPLLHGRDFDDRIDDAEAAPVVIVNRTMAETLWPGESALGKRFYLGTPGQAPLVEVVGVVADARYRHVREDPQFFLYRPLSQNFVGAMTLHVRTEIEPGAILPAVRDVVRELDSNLVLADVDPLASFVETDLWAERMSANLLLVFGLVALALAIVGVYGMVSYAATLRHREFGIRYAVGARRGDIVRAVLTEALSLVAIGIGVGLALALPLFVLVKHRSTILLEAVSPFDFRTYLVFTLALTAAALVGCLWPAWRASLADPQRLLREE